MAKIRGAKELRAAIRKMPPDLKAEATKEVRASTKRMHRKVMELLNSAASYAPFWHGKPGMQNVTTALHAAGTARRNYRYSVVKQGMTGRVGLLSPAAERTAFHMRFFLYGTVHQPARNVHADAFESERDVFIDNQTKALGRVLSRLG